MDRYLRRFQGPDRAALEQAIATGLLVTKRNHHRLESPWISYCYETNKPPVHVRQAYKFADIMADLIAWEPYGNFTLEQKQAIHAEMSKWTKADPLNNPAVNKSYISVYKIPVKHSESVGRRLLEMILLIADPPPVLPIAAGRKRREGVPAKLRFTVLHRDQFRCVYCGQTVADGVSLEVDHVVPVSKGGLTVPENLVTACFACNRGKGDALS